MPEQQNIEFKSSWHDDYLKWICGFANAQGGRIYIGKNDTGKVVGVEDYKDIMDEVPNKIKNLMGITAELNLLQEADKYFIEIVVQPYSVPISLRGRYYYRSGSVKQELTGAALNEFLLKRAGITWDGVSIPNVKIDDLSLIALQRFRNEAARSGRVDEEVLNDSIEHILKDLHLIDDTNGNLKRAAILLFHAKPEKFVIGAYIKIGFFHGDDDDLAFHDEVSGSLMEQIDKAFDLLKSKYIFHAISYEGVSRREKTTFPMAALRESLLNAVAHKDYSSGIPIQISVYLDRIVFWNPGQLPKSIPLESLFLKHPSVPYNPNIANTLFRSGDIETWGRGYRKILKSVLEHKQMPPTIKDLGGLMLTYYTDVSTQIKEENADNRLIQIVEHVIKNGSINNSEVQKMLKTSKPTATRLLKQAEKWLTKQGERGKGTVYTMKWKELIGS